MIWLGLLVAVAAAARSTWSPCGLSMLSSLTPFGEKARGHRYWVTATWYILGAMAGGASLGGIAALGAAAVRMLGLARHPAVAAALVAVTALLTTGVDAEVFGEVLPVVRRQVDDRWLSAYRRWVYATGFGWQIGAGLVTYVMTAAVVLLVAVGVLSASPWLALGLGTAFGLLRGSTVLLTGRAADPFSLRHLHGRIDRLGPAVRWSVTGAQLVVALAAAGEIGPVWAVAAAVLAAGGIAGRRLPLAVAARRS